jgi:Uma2 family endonuclease
VSTIAKPLVSVEEFARRQDVGDFEGRHVELLDGELFEVTKNPEHNAATDALAEALRDLLPRGRFRVREEKSVAPWTLWCPEPDIAVVRGKARDYFHRHPGPADIVLVAEVCESSPQDRTVKLAGYARAGFPVYWILDLGLRRLEVYSNPIAGAYQAPKILGETESVDLAIDGQVLGRIAVGDLLP